MGPKGPRGEKVQMYFCYRSAETETKTFFVSRVGKAALVQEEWKDLMENRSDTMQSYHDTVRVNLLRTDYIYVISMMFELNGVTSITTHI